MKRIGLIGGTSWPSTIEYYRLLNQLVAQKLGGHHSANIVLHSIDYHAIKSHYTGDWDKIPQLLRQEVETFLLSPADCLILCNNTLHKAYDIIAPELKLTIPFFHAVELTAQHAARQNRRNVLLLATRFTMEDGFYTSALEAQNIKVEVPSAEHRARIQTIQSELAAGNMMPEYKTYFRQLLDKYTHLDAVILACTELPLAITQDMTNLEVINPVELQCRAAVDYATA